MICKDPIHRATIALLLWSVAVTAQSQEATQEPAANAAEASTATAPAPATMSRSEMIWKEALEQMVPVTPDEAGELRAADDALLQATSPRVAPGDAESEAITVSLEPGAKSPVLTLLHGFTTSIEVLDASGQPWPVVQPTVGDSEAVTVGVVGGTDAVAEGQESPRHGSVLTLTPKAKFTATNLVLVLQGQARPISLILRSQESSASTVLQDRITLLVAAMGPHARPQVARGYAHLDGASEDLRAVLLGRAPSADARELLGADLPQGMRAWRQGNQLWLRADTQLISPAPQARLAMGEVNAYRMDYLPVIVVSREGRLANINMMEVLP